jgi:hypothetical protein
MQEGLDLLDREQCAQPQADRQSLYDRRGHYGSLGMETHCGRRNSLGAGAETNQ